MIKSQYDRYLLFKDNEQTTHDKYKQGLVTEKTGEKSTENQNGRRTERERKKETEDSL